MNDRKYHIVVRNDRTGRDTYQTGYPMRHVECMTMMRKLTPDAQRPAYWRKQCRTLLVEVS